MTAFTNPKIYVGAYDLTGVLNAASLNHSAAMLNASVFGNTTKVNMAGNVDSTINVAGFAPALGALADLTDEAIFGDVGSQQVPVTLMPTNNPAEGDACYFLSIAGGSYQIGGKHGDLLGYQFSGNGGTLGYPLVRGTVLESGLTKRLTTSTGAGTNAPGAATATQYVYAVLHVFQVQGTNPTLDVVIKSDDAANFVGNTTRFTFTQKTGIGSQYIARLAGPITDTYWRAEWTIGGSNTPGFTFAVALGVAGK